MVYRIYCEKKKGLDNEAKALMSESKTLLGIKGLDSVRVLNRYDVENITPETFEQSKRTVFSEPQLDNIYSDLPETDGAVFAVEYLPGQFDQRADSASQCIQLMSQAERPTVKSAKVYILNGSITEDDVEIIKKYYHTYDFELINSMLDNPHSVKSIKSKAHRLGITSLNQWSEDEINILKVNYSTMTVDDIAKLLPNRSNTAIISTAIKLGIKNQRKWQDWQIQYIVDNWELEPDKIMCKKIGKTFRAVKAKREELGLYRRNMDSLTYESIAKYIRGNITDWKTQSMEECNYCCVLTNSKDFQIHHLYGVSNLLEDIKNKYNIVYKDNFEEYTSEELSFILEKFIEEQSKYPLGQCVRKDLHKLFHSLYGQYYNTVDQWEQFKEDYRNGVYNDIINKQSA